ncbi:MAG: Molybdopterin molybdenumtransferase [Candidatus Heimdallarchaeota archaeon LC_3]|nr:MAG: Molybdopterin molybdenumtransferase [Candidatus Heimdallarchaeota archaeon LC_3]
MKKVSVKNEFLTLLSLEQANKIIADNFSWKRLIEKISIENALSRVLGENISAKVDVPPFDRSRMDGYAVRAKDTFEIDEIHPKKFKIVDSVAAGEFSKKLLFDSYTCIEIATGAPIPVETNAVVMIEYTSKVAENEIEIFRPVTPQENIESAGSDVMLGEIVLYKDDIITPIRLGILSSMGLSQVPVYRKMKIGVISTGNELTKIGEDLEYGNIYDSNSIILINLIKNFGGETIDLGICKDDLNEYFNLIKNNIDKVDLLLISGGTSAGESDYSYRIIKEMGGILLFHGVSLKPGKPVAVGLIKEKMLIILPGFPASAIFAFNSIVDPLLKKVLNLKVKESQKIKAKVGQKFRNTSGRTEFKLVYLIEENSVYYVFPIKATSGSISALERADGYITIPDSLSNIEIDETIEVTLFKDKLTIPDLVFIGSHDFFLNSLTNELKNNFPATNLKLIYTGSTGGLISISQNKCDITAIHLLDSESKTYNKPFIKKYGLEDKIIFVSGYKRIQGLIIPKGNPKKIQSLQDLMRKDLKFLNRNEGSGTRILLDILLKDFSNTLEKDFKEVINEIEGYDAITFSHSGAAISVKRGARDVSIGIKSYADLFDLDFIQLQEEDYDFLIRKSSLDKPAVKNFISLLKSRKFAVS